jgi:hypothetical protein
MNWIAKNVEPELAEYLFNIKLTLPQRIGLVQRDVRADLVIDFDLLEGQLSDTPEMLAFFDMLLAEQVAKVATMKRRVKRTRGLTLEALLESSRMAHGREMRRADCEDLVESDDQVVKTEAELILEQLKEDRIKSVVEAIKMKSEHLRSLAGFKRQERQETRT